MATETLLADQQVLPAKLQSTHFPFRHPTIEKALEDLLHSPTDH
jgi:NAD dependent epimerase/dehydratase family enzyme